MKYTESHLVRTSRRSCSSSSSIVSDDPSSLNHPFLLPSLIMLLKVSQRVPDSRMTRTAFRATAMGSVATVSSSDEEVSSLLSAQSVAARIAHPEQRLTVCAKHEIMRSAASNTISQLAKITSSDCMMLQLFDALSRVKCPISSK